MTAFRSSSARFNAAASLLCRNQQPSYPPSILRSHGPAASRDPRPALHPAPPLFPRPICRNRCSPGAPGQDATTKTSVACKVFHIMLQWRLKQWKESRLQRQPRGTSHVGINSQGFGGPWRRSNCAADRHTEDENQEVVGSALAQ